MKSLLNDIVTFQELKQDAEESADFDTLERKYHFLKVPKSSKMRKKHAKTPKVRSAKN